jgi:hypothetical protein
MTLAFEGDRHSQLEASLRTDAKAFQATQGRHLVHSEEAVSRLVENAVCPKCGTDTVQRIVRRALRQCTSCYVFYLKHTEGVVRGEIIRARRKEHTA